LWSRKIQRVVPIIETRRRYTSSSGIDFSLHMHSISRCAIGYEHTVVAV
jgi:hypothetical protein